MESFKEKTILRSQEVASDEKDLISSLPQDLKLPILAELPPKSISKFISVSKLWSTIVRGKDLTDLFISRSSTRPKFLFILESSRILEFHWYSREEPFVRQHHQVTSITPKPSLSVISSCPISDLSSPIRGLIAGQQDDSQVICNPSTGQILTLPMVNAWRREPLFRIYNFLGYDPVNDQYKILYMMLQSVVSEEHQVLTLGDTENAWKKIECKHPHVPATNEICKDGVVYYGAWCNIDKEGSIVVSFDLRSEDFGVIKLPEGVKILQFSTDLVNYHGKIALVDSSFRGDFDLWVLVDIKKQEWSKISFFLPVIDRTWSKIYYCRGTISTGEIVFAPYHFTNPFFLVYFDLKGNKIRRVDIEGVRDSTGDNNGPITVFMDHVESPMFL